MDFHWHEISDCIPRIEQLVEDQTFPQRELAASVASKVLYHLDEHNDALRLALEAGEYFDISEDNKYINTLVHQCIEIYIQKRV